MTPGTSRTGEPPRRGGKGADRPRASGTCLGALSGLPSCHPRVAFHTLFSSFTTPPPPSREIQVQGDPVPAGTNKRKPPVVQMEPQVEQMRPLMLEIKPLMLEIKPLGMGSRALVQEFGSPGSAPIFAAGITVTSI